MEIEQLIKEFNDNDSHYLKFSEILNPPSNRPDLCAFILLDKLVPEEKCDIISASEHDEIYLSISIRALAKVITTEDILYIIRCGVRFAEEYDCLTMFV